MPDSYECVNRLLNAHDYRPNDMRSRSEPQVKIASLQRAGGMRHVVAHLIIHYSLFTIHYSLFTIHYSLFPHACKHQNPNRKALLMAMR